uniref:effector-associated constant component EACC1 n=1 Tax=Amycolatopsis sp. CA-096443 TaxID=3239919 RepID=UPI003F4935D5
MDLQIRFEGGAFDDYVALADRLNSIRDFRGRVRQELGPPEDGTLDAGVIEMLTVAVGSGGLGVALTNSLNTWLETRRAGLVAKVTVTAKRRTVKLRARDANTEAVQLLGEILRDADER